MEQEKRKNKKLLLAVFVICGALLVTALTAVIAGVAANSGRPSEPTDGYVLFVKDGALYYDSLDGISFCVTDKLLAYDPSEYETEHRTEPQLYACATAVAAGDKLFYVERLAGTPDGDDLYVRSTKTADDSPIKLAENIAAYYPAADGSCAVCLDKDGNLFRCFSEDGSREEIAKNVPKHEVSVTKDAQNLIYQVRENGKETMFRKLGDAPAEEIPLCDSCSYAGDMRVLWYIDEKNDLYRMDADGSTTFISANAYEIAKLYPTGEAYFTTVAEKACKADQWILNNTDDKVLAEKTVTRYGLYYYDGEQSTCLTQYMPDYFLCLSFAADTPACAFLSLEDADRTVFSLFKDLDPLSHLFTDALQQISKLYVAHGGEVSLVPSEGVRWMDLDKNGRQLAFISFAAWNSREGDLFEVELKDGNPAEPVFVASNVNDASPQYLDDGRLYYQKDRKNFDGWYHYDIYLDDTLIGENYFGGSLVSGISDGKFHFFTDRKGTFPYEYGTLYRYDGTSARKIASSVLDSHARTLPDGKLLYLAKFNESSDTGSLYLYDGKKRYLIGKDISVFRYTNPDEAYPISIPYLGLKESS